MQENLFKLINFKEIQRYLNTFDMDIELCKDITKLKKIVNLIPNDDYPYQWDAAFNEEYLETNDYFCILLYQNKNIIGTYAARHMDVKNYLYDVRHIFLEDSVSESLNFEKLGLNKNSWYSSLQWISKKSRGQRIGIFLDYIKKSLVFEIYNADYNYAIHKEDLLNYHINKLNYDHSDWLMTIKKGIIGSSDSLEDKVYYLCNVRKQSWLKKQNDLYNYL